MIDSLAWVGSILLALCGAPLAYQAYINKHAEGINWVFLHMWFWGELFVWVYVIRDVDWPLIFNYTANIIFILIIAYYKNGELNHVYDGKNFRMGYR